MTTAGQVKQQVGRGMATMLARFVFVTPLSFLASVVLASLLTPADFGTFATCSVLVMGIGGLFELGLMSVLIQQPDEPSVREQRAVFTIYLIVFGALAMAMALLAPLIVPFFRLGEGGVAMLRWMALHIVINVVGAIPNMLLERRMRFGVVAALDVATFLLDKGLAIGLALSGFGVWSFIWASLAAVTIRMALLTVAAPWSFGLAWDREMLGEHLARGALFQGVNLATLARENMNTFIAGPLFGPAAVGLLNWGFNLPMLVAGNALAIFQRVFFPAFARLHDQPEERARLLIDGMRLLLLALLPALAYLPALGGPIVSFLYGENWRAALPALAWFALRLAAHAVYGPLIWYLNATGRVETGFRAMLAAIALEWAAAFALLPFLGFTGVAAGGALGSVVLAGLLWARLSGEVGLRLREVLLPGVALALPLGAGMAFAATMVGSLHALVAALAMGGGAWLAALLVLEHRRARAAWEGFRARGTAAAPAEKEEECARS